jgi:hypothetical protein
VSLEDGRWADEPLRRRGRLPGAAVTCCTGVLPARGASSVLAGLANSRHLVHPVVRTTAQVLGYGRTSQDIAERIGEVVDDLIDGGDLRRNGPDQISPA